MAGHQPSDHNPDTWEIMAYGMTRREELEYLKLTVIVSAIVTAGRMAAGAEAGDGLRNALKSYRSSMFPEIESDLLEKAQQNERILEQEYSRGPMKVQSLEYGSKRKKKR